jgi:hypothetical protein
MATRIVKAHLESVTPYSQSRRFENVKNADESHDAFDNRIWRERCTVNDDGIVVIPASALKKALDSGAKKKGEKINKAFASKMFLTGVICTTDVPLGTRKEDVKSIRLAQNSKGLADKSLDVFRTFPLVPKWNGIAEFAVFDDSIPKDKFEEYLNIAGLFVGIGRWSPRVGGLNGRFKATKFEWSKL